MNALTSLALTSEPMLRVIQAGGYANLSDLAIKSGRDKRHITRDLATLEKGGLISKADGRPCLTPAALDQLAAIERANAAQPLFDEIERDPFNPRTDFDPEFIAGLAESIYAGGKRNGMLQRIIIRRREGGERPYRLVAGENRLRAIGLLIEDGRWPRDLPPPTEIRDMTDEQAEVFALIENVQRMNLNAIDEATRYRHFRDQRGWSTAKIAEVANRSQKHVQNLLRCLELPEDIQARMRLPKDHELYIGAREARSKFQVSKAPERPKAPQLSPKLALALLELAHKIDAAPMIINGETGFTALTHRPCVGCGLATLNERKIIALREWGGQVFAKILLHSSGAVTFLEDAGFYGPKRDEAVWKARTAVMSPHQASEATRGGRYIIPELNTELAPEEPKEPAEAEEAAAADEPQHPIDQAYAAFGAAVVEHGANSDQAKEARAVLKEARAEAATANPVRPEAQRAVNERMAEIGKSLATDYSPGLASAVALNEGLDEEADEEAIDTLIGGLRQSLFQTLGNECRWNRETVDHNQLAADAVSAFMGGQIIEAVVALMGLYHRLDEEAAERLLRKAAEGKNRPEGEEPEAKLFRAADATRTWMLDRYNDLYALPGAEDAYRDLAGALNDVSQGKKAETPLLVLRPGDVVEKYPGGATAHRLLTREDDAPRVCFRAQPIRNGKDYGKPAKLALNEIAAFAR